MAVFDVPTVKLEMHARLRGRLEWCPNVVLGFEAWRVYSLPNIVCKLLVSCMIWFYFPMALFGGIIWYARASRSWARGACKSSS